MLTLEDFENIRKKYEEEQQLREQLNRENAERMHAPSWDLQMYVDYNTVPYELEDIEAVLAAVPSLNDGDTDQWFWLLKLKDGMYAYTYAWHSFEGWDYHSGGKSVLDADLLKLIDQVPSIDILANMIRQLRGEQAIGTRETHREEIDATTGDTYMYYQIYDYDGLRFS
jgi:hypothetical protein